MRAQILRNSEFLDYFLRTALVSKDSPCKFSNERWQFPLESTPFWLKERTHKKWVALDFSSAHLPFHTARCDPKIASKQCVFVFRVGSIAAPVTFDDSSSPIAFAENAIRLQ